MPSLTVRNVRTPLKLALVVALTSSALAAIQAISADRLWTKTDRHRLKTAPKAQASATVVESTGGASVVLYAPRDLIVPTPVVNDAPSPQGYVDDYADLECPDGKVAVSAGFQPGNNAGDTMYLTSSFPMSGGRWRISVRYYPAETGRAGTWIPNVTCA